MLIPSALRGAHVPARCAAPQAALQLVPPGGMGGIVQLLSLNAALEVGAFAAVLGVAYIVRARPYDAAELENEEASGFVGAFCRPDGWLLRCEIAGERNNLIFKGTGDECHDTHGAPTHECRRLRQSRRPIDRA